MPNRNTIVAILARLGMRDAPTLRQAKWIASNWTVVFAGLLLYSVLSALTLIVVARRVLPVEYGQYLASYALTSFLVVLPGFGLDAWLLTQSSSKDESAGDLWTRVTGIRVRLLLLWVAGMIGLGFLLPRPSYPLAIYLPTVAGMAFDSLLLLAFAALRVQNRHGRVTILQGAYSLALFAMTLLLPIGNGRIAVFAVARTLLSLVFVALVYAPMARTALRARRQFEPGSQVLRLSVPFMWADLASNVYVKADVTIVSIILGPAGTGAYGPAVSLLQASFLVSRALFFFSVPVLSRTYVEERWAFARRSVSQFVAQAATGFVIAVFLLALAPWLVRVIFQQGYEESAYVLRILSPVAFLRALNMGLGAVLMSGRRQSQRTRVQLAAAALNIVANLIVVGRYGLVGVSVVYILTELVLLAGYVALSTNLLKRERKPKPLESMHQP
jgi:O-antigen/teichoic acid export membrane protein